MNLFVVFLILILALAGMGTIWYVTSRGKCVVPSTNDCPAGQAYYCSSDDAQPTCTDIATVCGSWPTGKKCTPDNCVYDTKSKKYIWQKCADQGGGGDITGNPCTVDSTGALNHKVAIGQVLQDYSIPAAYYKSYVDIILANQPYCQLNSCTDPYILDADTGLCVAKDNKTNTTVDQCTLFDDGETHDKTDINASWLIRYKQPVKPGDEPVKYCQFSACSPSYPINDNGICKQAGPPPSQCDGYVTDNTNHVVKWTYSADAGGYCFIDTDGCQDGWVPPQNPKGKDAKCVQKCVNDDTFVYTLVGDTCTKTGCVNPDYKFSNGDCIADCTKQSNINRIFGGTPATQVGFTYGITNGTIQGISVCIPTGPSGSGDVFGGCGDATHTMYALNKDNSGCAATVNGNTAKFNDGTNGGTVGCLACQPRVCPAWATSLSQCTGDVENDCGFTNELVVGDENTPVQTCVNELSPTSTSIWRQFGNYDASGSYSDPAAYNKGSAITMRTTSGAPLNYTQWRLFFTGKGWDPSIHIDPLTSELEGSLEIQNFSETNDTALTFWAWSQVARNSSQITIKVSDIWKCIRDNYLTKDATGDATVTIALNQYNYDSGFYTGMVVQNITVNKTTFSTLFKPLDFKLS